MPLGSLRIKQMETYGTPDLERRFEERLRAAPAAFGATEVLDRVLEAAGELRGRRVLDAGCGTGELARRLDEAGARVAGLDRCANLLGRVRSGARVQADVRELPFRDGVFDLAASVLVLHYLDDPRRSLAELRRVLRPGGRLVVCDRICSADPVLRAAQVGVERLRNPMIQRILSSEELEDHVRGCGFDVLRQVEFRRSEALESWLSGTEARRIGDVRDEVARLRGRDLGGFRVCAADRIELRMALVEARRPAG